MGQYQGEQNGNRCVKRPWKALEILRFARGNNLDIVGVTGSIPVAPTIHKAGNLNGLLAFPISGLGAENGAWCQIGGKTRLKRRTST